MQINNINSTNALSQSRDISYTKIEQAKESSVKRYISKILIAKDKEVVPKESIEILTKKYGENFLDGIGKNDNNQITFGDLNKHLKENLKGADDKSKTNAFTGVFSDSTYARLKEDFKDDKVPKSGIDHIKNTYGENFLDDFHPKDSNNITYKELGDFMKANLKDDGHKPLFIQNILSENGETLSHDEIKSVIQSEIKDLSFKDLKRSDFMFKSAYSRVDISKIFMDVAI
jgi:hypothetical protein